MPIVIVSAKICPEGRLLDHNCYLEKPNFTFKNIFIEPKLSLYIARETSIPADFGKHIFFGSSNSY